MSQERVHNFILLSFPAPVHTSPTDTVNIATASAPPPVAYRSDFFIVGYVIYYINKFYNVVINLIS